MENENALSQIFDVEKQARDLNLKHWAEFEFLTWQWWLGIGLILAPLIIWWLFVDKKRLLRIAFFGCFVIALAVFLDVTGSDLLLWTYPIRIIPQSPLLFPIDIVDLPITLMFIYQKVPKWGKFLLWNALISAIMSFVLEPLAVHINVYRLITWKFYYSLPLYIAVAALAKVITDYFAKKQSAALYGQEKEGYSK